MKSVSLRRLGLVVGGMAMIVTPIFATVSQAATAWGPSRPTLTLNGNSTPGMDHVQFNSIVNNPNYGDERGFFDGKLSSNTTTGGFSDNVSVQPGQELLLRTYVHNNADSSLNASGVGIAHNTKVSIQLPTATDNNLRATSLISADNATPGTVWASMDFHSTTTPFGLSYVPGSAVQYTNAVTSGIKLNDSIVNGGALIGYDKADGNVPGCFQYTSIVTIKVKVNGPSINLTKQVAQVGAPWQSSLTAKVGDTLSWLINYKNTSNVEVQNAVIKDQLPAHLQLVPGSVMIVDAVHPNGVQVTDQGLFSAGGQSVGNLAANNGGGYIKYKTTVLNDLNGADCTVQAQNNAIATATGVAPVNASATVTVTKTCQTTPPPSTPPLPQTGPESALAGIFGTGAIGYATRAYLRSKRAVVDSLKSVAKR